MTFGTDREPGPLLKGMMYLLGLVAAIGMFGGIPSLMVIGIGGSMLLIVGFVVYAKATEQAGQFTRATEEEGQLTRARASTAEPSQESASPPAAVVLGPMAKRALTPSEVVYLASNQFAPLGNPLASYGVMADGTRLSKQDLAQQAWAAAFVGAERSGMLQLNIRPTKALLGLRTAHRLYADPPNGSSAYPMDSLESRLATCSAVTSRRQGNTEVWRIVNALVPTSYEPYLEACRLVEASLTARNLMWVSHQKHLLLGDKAEIHVPETTFQLAAAQVNAVRTLLIECGQTRPEIAAKLVQDIDKGIRKSKYQDLPESW